MISPHFFDFFLMTLFFGIYFVDLKAEKYIIREVYEK